MRRKVLAVAAVVAAATIAGGVTASDRVLSDGTEISALFDSSVGLYPGSDVQVLGVSVGKVRAVEPEGEVVRVRMELDEGRRVAADTGAVIVAPTLVSDRFVQLTSPYDGGKALADGATIETTAVPVEIDELYASLTDLGENLGPNGVNKDGALSRFLTVLARNLDGQGADINTMLTDVGDASATLTDVDDDFFATIAHLDTLDKTLLAHDEGVASANRQLAKVASYLADDREDLGGAIDSLAAALAVLDDFIRDNRTALRRSVNNLHGPTQALVDRRASLEEAVRTIPLALSNFVDAYDTGAGRLRGRGNLNEIGVWAGGYAARTSPDAPPLLLPQLGEGE